MTLDGKDGLANIEEVKRIESVNNIGRITRIISKVKPGKPWFAVLQPKDPTHKEITFKLVNKNLCFILFLNMLFYPFCPHSKILPCQKPLHKIRIMLNFGKIKLLFEPKFSYVYKTILNMCLIME